ncbi:hypothetical protein J2Z62_000439 [Mycoplasmoides fastidiosum]|uniref:Lipoprotein n=1 Tax=Mycoplasmoides fastidiosum TaxID=92758 RepID=A0ABU0LZ63_9BACT|nr:hypothetical protein [Mycoplasmoides fastidiosum]MDQ0514001.1 hypothetical protein [Mycoplasmoides fastidiosum]UUD37586.1 hypothetical protein NPA10_03395 [Mycoplasmoides fastidiosum]
MKKLNLFKKNKLWLASLGLTTTSSLVLAACASQKQTPNNNAGNNSGNSNNQNNNSGTETPKEPVVPSTPAVPEAKVATEAQKALVNAVLANPGVQKVLQVKVQASQKTIIDHIKTVTLIDTFNQTTVAESIKNLGKPEDSAADAKTSTVNALIKTLETNVTSATAEVVPTGEKANFAQALTKVKTDAANLLTSLNDLPKDNPKVLEDLETKLTTALTQFISATGTETATKLTTLINAKNEYESGVKKVAEKLVAAEQKAFVLDSATSALANYVNTKVATFLTVGNDKDKHTATLNNLVAQVRTGVLGTLGFSVWTAGNLNTKEAKRNLPAGIEESTKTTQLYTIIAGLADQEASWNTVTAALKSLTYHQSLLTKTESAINLLALYIEQAMPVDTARLNAYLVHDKSNIVKLLQAATGTNVINIISDIANSLANYEKYLVAGTGSGAQAKLVQDLDDLSKQLTESSQAANKTAVDALKTAAAGLVTKFAAFRTEWDKTKVAELLWNKNDKTTVYPLLVQATGLNQAIGVTKDFGDVTEVVGHVETLATTINQITTALDAMVNKQANPLFTKLTAIVNDIKGTTDGTFGKVLTDFVGKTFSTGKTNADAIATAAKAGYVYTDLVQGKARSGTTAANLTFEQLDAELKKLQAGNNKALTTILNLLNNQLRPNQGSQTFAQTRHLVDLFNNGNVLADSENH